MGYVRGFPPGRSLTRADLESMPHDGHRYELLDGILIVSPSPRPLHQRAILRLIVALEPACPVTHEVLPAPVDVVLAEDTVLIPDIVVGRRDAFTEQALVGPPLLAVEVLSPRTRHFDLHLKRAKFAEAGCPHYWVVDPDEPRMRCWTLAPPGAIDLDPGSTARETDGYIEVASVAGDQWLEADAPFPVRVRPSDLVSRYR
ncbi:Uma2 family endonuclease [Saccharopolyspora taberi]|uniref:Uma2 family endonuclease n=1 Tax=Saccharopolyspora taberi TaxID=60895 RepID=A0ABN3VK41_9PSEU